MANPSGHTNYELFFEITKSGTAYLKTATTNATIRTTVVSPPTSCLSFLAPTAARRRPPLVAAVAAAVLAHTHTGDCAVLSGEEEILLVRCSLHLSVPRWN